MLLTATLFVYLSYALIPWWFFVLVFVRLGVVAAGNTLLYVAQGFVEPETSYLSKASIFSIMLLFAAKILSIPYGLLVRGPSPLTIDRLDTLQLMVAGVLIVSTFEKINLIGNRLKGILRGRDRASAPAGRRAGWRAGGSAAGDDPGGGTDSGPAISYGTLTTWTPPSFSTRTEYLRGADRTLPPRPA